MEKNRSSKVVAVVALVVAVFGLTLGFAAFSNTLVISSSAHVTPDESAFNVVFSNAENTITAGEVEGVGSTGATGEKATITGADQRTISGLRANFTAPGQTVTYTFYVHNAGSYAAYLRSVLFKGIGGTEDTKKCTIPEGKQTTQGLVDAACEDISISIKVGNEAVTKTSSTYTGHSLAANTGEAHGKETVIVTIDYAAKGTDGQAHPVDGEMEVAFGDITLDYSSVDGE